MSSTLPIRRRRPPRPGALQDLSPPRIATQIVLLQLAYYGSATVLVTFSALAAGRHMHIRYLLSWDQLRADVTEGWMWALCWILNAGITAIYLLLLIARSKLIPDFALTIHLLHLLSTSLYSRSLPRNAFWWVVQGASAALMTSLGVWSCRWRELQPINFGGGGGPSRGTVGRVFGAVPDDGEGDSVGFEMGERRGKDGYEAVGNGRAK